MSFLFFTVVRRSIEESQLSTISSGEISCKLLYVVVCKSVTALQSYQVFFFYINTLRLEVKAQFSYVS